EPRYLELARTRGSRIDANESARQAGAIPAVCDAFDEWLGELLARLPADATLMLVSDHGFKGVEVADAIAIDLNGLLEGLGYLERSADGTIEWPRTRAFNLPDAAEVVRGIHLNLAGRDEAGTVNPAEAAALLSGLAGSLADLRPDAGPALFRSIRIAADPKAGEPELEVVADDGVEPGAWVLVGRGRVRVRDLYGRVVDLFGVHAQGGILLASGPGIARGRTGWQASLIDVAPTVLHLLGLPPSRTMQGRRVEEILDEPPGRELPQADSYEDVAPGPGPLNRPVRMIREEMGRLQRLEHVR
ncbi:MAG TPA: alkaline phosphatase family protein, partial [Candidatus Polarisedimenticolia bacterium]|nr:alkaline phosphatase family protein [Candidatus Polarisedimenticolia bacterium]